MNTVQNLGALESQI